MLRVAATARVLKQFRAHASHSNVRAPHVPIATTRQIHRLSIPAASSNHKPHESKQNSQRSNSSFPGFEKRCRKLAFFVLVTALSGTTSSDEEKGRLMVKLNNGADARIVLVEPTWMNLKRLGSMELDLLLLACELPEEQRNIQGLPPPLREAFKSFFMSGDEIDSDVRNIILSSIKKDKGKIILIYPHTDTNSPKLKR